MLVPDILEQIDLNVLCVSFDIFDPELSKYELAARAGIYERALWALSNLAANQSIPSRADECIIYKALYRKVIQIALTSRDHVLDLRMNFNTKMKMDGIEAL